MTAHEQLQTELGRSPRRHKLAVKVKRNLPSCRLTPGKWYVHAHQVKIETEHGGKLQSRRLKTKRLISVLRSVFGRAYFPRLKSSKLKTQQHRTRVEPKKTHIPLNTTATTTFQPLTTLSNNFSLPMQAPTPPWANPAFYIGQTPYGGAMLGTGNLQNLTHAVINPGKANSKMTMQTLGRTAVQEDRRGSRRKN